MIITETLDVYLGRPSIWSSLEKGRSYVWHAESYTIMHKIKLSFIHIVKWKKNKGDDNGR